MISTVLIREICENADRVLSLLNKNPLDTLCGSFDREYWAWNFKDYPNMSLQAGTHLLTLLWDTEFEGNRFSPSLSRGIQTSSRGQRQRAITVRRVLVRWIFYQHRKQIR